MAAPARFTPLRDALELAGVGLRVVPIAPGMKRPTLTAWADAATNDAETIQAWWTGLYRGHGVGIALGPQPNGMNLFAVDVDGDEGKRNLRALVHQHGKLPATWTSDTGGGGHHFVFRAPDHIDVRNQQAAGARIAKHIDVRGSGGQIVVAPTVHPTTKRQYAWRPGRAPWECEVADAPDWLLNLGAPIEPEPAEEPTRPTPAADFVVPPTFGDDESPAEWLRGRWDWTTELESTGWTVAATKPNGDTWWTRPGKSVRDGHSAVLHGTDGPIVVFTTEIPNDLAALGKTTADGSGRSYSPLDWFAAHRHGGNVSEASRALRGHMVAERAPAPASGPLVASGGIVGPQGVDPLTGEIRPALNLPEDFWDSRAELAHIRQAAHSRRRSADAVLLFTLARAVATIHPSYTLPAITGGRSSLNFLGAVVAPSGGGKSSAGAVARDLVPIDLKSVVADVPPGSGEGLAEMFFELISEEGSDGKKRKVKRQTKTGAFIYLDEGEALAQMGSRKGATLLPTLRAAWSAEVIGQSNATQETHRVLKPHTYRMSIVVGFQPEYAADLVADQAGGTPQRFVFAAGSDPAIPDERPAWPGELRLPALSVVGGGVEFDVAGSVVDEIDARALAAARGQARNPLDSHRDLVRLRLAACLGVLNGRQSVSEDDWDLSGEVMAASDAVRGDVMARASMQAAEREAAHLSRQTAREAASERAAERRAVQSGARSLARKVWKDGGDVNRKVLSLAVASKHKKVAELDEMIDHAIGEEWIEATPNGWRKGPKQP